MGREYINDKLAEEVTGGSIVFNGDHTTCGYNCNDQYEVVDYDDVQSYILSHYKKMSERTMIKNMVEQGLLVEL